jgi:hypothetical protein
VRDAPGYLDRGTFSNYSGYSFWLFFAAVHWTLLITSMYLFIEVAAGAFTRQPNLGRSRR